MEKQHHVISIGRQLGSGGADMGKAIAEHLGFRYIDKEILIKAAKELDVPEENLEYVDEKSASVLSAMAKAAVYEMPYITDEWHVPTGKQLFETQTKIMKAIAGQGPCVIIGRCASYLFRNYSKHTSIFLHAKPEKRMERLAKTLGKPLNPEKDRKILEKSDKERARYYNTFTGRKWLDLKNYDFVLDTTPFSDEQIKELLLDYITAKFPELGGK